MSVRRTAGEAVFSAANYLFMILLSFAVIYPFWYVIVLAFNDGQDAMKGGVYWWPRVFSLVNFRYVLASPEIGRAFIISVLRTSIGTVGSILFTAMVAFGLSRKELPGRKGLMVYVFITMLFGGGLIPYYLLLRDLRLLNHFAVYVVPGLFGVWNMIIMKTAFNEVPASLVESAMIDGASYPRILWSIVLPVSRPTLAALSLFTAVGHWNDWFTGVFFVNDARLIPLQTYLQRILSTAFFANMAYQGQGLGIKSTTSGISALTLRMATVVVAMTPILLVYPFVQKHFLKGIMIGALKE